MLPPKQYEKAQQRTALYQQLFERLKSLESVRYVGEATRLPLASNRSTTNVTSDLTIEGQNPPAGQKPSVDFRRATREYFRAMGIPLLEGREFTERDTPEALPVVVVNDRAARLFFSGARPVGTRIQLGPNPNSAWYTVVGVVGSIRHMGLDALPRPEVYLHTLQNPPMAPFIVMRTTADSSGLIPRVRSEIQKLDRGIPIFNIATMEELVADSLAEQRFNMLLMGLFAGIALVLAAVGIYGVIACSVDLRTNEIGIRMAMGAQRHDVIRLVAVEVLQVALTGLIIGSAGAFALTRLMSSLLYAVQPTDPTTYLAVTVVQLGVALAASCFPMLKATKVNPVEALRCD